MLRFENVTVGNYIKNISFTLYKGEILGFAGLLGAGKTEIAKTLFGVFGKGDAKVSGKIFFEGKEIKPGSPAKSIANKIGLVPENRAIEGLITEMSIMDNMLMVSMKQISKFGWINTRKRRQIAESMIEKLKVKCNDPMQMVSDLSGGNQQKVVLAKWLALGAKIIIFDEPTRGIDVGAKVAFYELMNELVSQGIGVIIMSSESEEVYNMSDTLVILKEGEISGILPVTEIKEKEMQQYM